MRGKAKMNQEPKFTTSHCGKKLENGQGGRGGGMGRRVKVSHDHLGSRVGDTSSLNQSRNDIVPWDTRPVS